MAIFLITSSCQLFAYDSSIFNIDENKIQSEFEQLNMLETYLGSNADCNIFDIKNNSEFQHVNLISNDSSKVVIDDGPPLGISSFIWGFCLSIPGVVIVYSITKDDEELKKAMLGCVLGTGLLGGCYSLSYGLSSW